MVLPIYTYGQRVLKRVAKPVKRSDNGLVELINNMWETMYNAKGVGLAAPQVGRSIRLFIVDTTQLEEEEKDFLGLKAIFINAEKIEETGEEWEYEEGCLSIPDIRGDVQRSKILHLRYLDENFTPQERIFEGINARVLQHEYDHIEGVLFTEHLKPLKKRRIKRKLEGMRQGIVEADYAIRPNRG
jgi:peptide deformylase